MPLTITIGVSTLERLQLAHPPSFLFLKSSFSLVSHEAPTLIYGIFEEALVWNPKQGAVIYRDHYVDFRNCAWESSTMDEFESKRLELIENCKLHENGLFQSLYEIGSKWVPVFVNHIFSAGMSTSQRAESCHSFFKKYVSKKNSLMDFILRFNRALAHQRYEELIADHTDSNGTLMLKSQWSMENQMAELYTQRWTKAAKCDVVVDDKGSEEASKILEDDLNNVLSKVKSVVSSDSISERHSSTPQIYNEPLAVRAKGCGKRLKGGKEKAKGKTTDNSRRCNGCGKVNHEDFNEGIIQDEAKKKASLNSDLYFNFSI
ncbi:hypothetical protein JRO89_XS11G0149800 [Xanthoceras sorbifolium]|uniref:Protein FAR1-RELATED SEQUENCE n=1 Tax=Xanthoceras sorbifolium TaxID=99658 RepID=A0ABQ8HFK7_9ROSI|nr:hypothetical protein JRO89_XS11G0149800 [Xanthoceras sorbifolium]